jgi:AAA15 family ATPase/GTPase
MEEDECSYKEVVDFHNCAVAEPRNRLKVMEDGQRNAMKARHRGCNANGNDNKWNEEAIDDKQERKLSEEERSLKKEIDANDCTIDELRKRLKVMEEREQNLMKSLYNGSDADGDEHQLHDKAFLEEK